MTDLDIDELFDGMHRWRHAVDPQREAIAQLHGVRRNRLEDIARDTRVHPLLRGQAERALQVLGRTRQVYDALDTLMRTQCAVLERALRVYTARDRAAPEGLLAPVTEMLFNFNLLGCVQAHRNLLLVALRFRSVLEDGLSPESKALVGELGAIALDVGEDELKQVSGAGTLVNAGKLLQALAGVRDALQVSEKAILDTSQWLARIDASHLAFQAWLVEVESLAVVMQAEAARWPTPG